MSNEGEGHNRPENNGHNGPHVHKITINVDGIDYEIEQKQWVVSALKTELKIDPAKVLAEITAHGLKDLADDDTTKLHNKERFMTHARSGGSS